MIFMQDKSIGAIVSFKNKFLIIQQKTREKPYNGFPKGHVEKKESDLQALARELKEETGIIDFELIPGFKESIIYKFEYQNEIITKTCDFYLIEVFSNKIVFDKKELAGFKWLEFEKALKYLTHQNSKELLIKANAFLSK